MAREKAPGSNFRDYHGSPQWGRRLTDPDDQRRVLTDCGTIVDGVRIVPWAKSGNPEDEARMRQKYAELGYEVADEGYKLVFRVKDSVYQERKARKDAEILARSRPKGKKTTQDGDGRVVDEDVLGEPVSTAELMGTA